MVSTKFLFIGDIINTNQINPSCSKMKKVTGLMICLLLTFSCARQQTIGLNPHKLNQDPRSILWFQIPGLSTEHLAMLRFSYGDMSRKTSFENMTCQGSLWSFNLYDIRPNAYKGFQSQMTASKNIQASCEHFRDTNIWSVFSDSGIDVSFYEHGATLEQSITKQYECEQNPASFKKGFFWVSRRGPPDAQFFHFQDQDPVAQPALRYDQTCQGRVCFADFSSNTMAIWNRFRQGRSRTVFVVRDFSYYNFLKSKNIPKAREQLIEIEKTIATFMQDPSISRNTLILITGAESMHFELPAVGSEWTEFERAGKFALFRHSSLMAPVFATGPRAENFCGIYEESEILGRLLYSTEERKIAQGLKGLFN
jgi:hypothetical protein